MLKVTDEGGLTAVDNVTVVVGNTRPDVTIEIPENGQFAAFGDKVPYKISVTDAEDGSTGSGINCADVTLNVSLGHDQHAHDAVRSRPAARARSTRCLTQRPRRHRERLHGDRGGLHRQGRARAARR